MANKRLPFGQYRCIPAENGCVTPPTVNFGTCPLGISFSLNSCPKVCVGTPGTCAVLLSLTSVSDMGPGCSTVGEICCGELLIPACVATMLKSLYGPTPVVAPPDSPQRCRRKAEIRRYLSR